MAMPRWTEECSLGNKTIDAEHQRLLGLLVRLEADLKDETNLDRRKITALVEELDFHVNEHFRHEEVLMASLSAMPDAERGAHRRDHERWRQQILTHLPGLSSSATDLELRAHLARVLLVGRDFWEEHFAVFDRRMQAFMSASNSATTIKPW